MAPAESNVGKSVVEQVYSYYPGCSLHATAAEYDVSTRLVCQKLGVELRELEDWVCCGASAAHSTDHLLSLALPAHTLKQAEEKGLPLAVPCAMCFSRLKFTLHELENKDTLDLVSGAVGKELSTAVTVKHMLQVLADEDIPLPIVKPLSGLKVACYYGCLLVRPPEVVGFDDAENPQTMDHLIERLGAEAIDWGLKTSCCGAGVAFARLDVVLKLSHRILSLAQKSGADCVAVACPMCHANLDMYQKDMTAKFGQKTELPVLYFTQLIGLSLGFSPKELLLDKHITNPLPMLREKKLT
ncbi:MAG: CoB--CoM heterodisulfide reductase iron-sulfur subunit B family protein [Dehalococcoidia bacterium]|nr:CoB--CoM heterodisulfide reductase iron-sulfur subunit B family protein [Dehalococcoidia bacterium]